jgi:outer membrane receptor for monomeric catechols
MPAGMLRMIAVAAVCFCDGAFAVASGQPRHAPASVQGSASSSQSSSSQSMDTLKTTRRAKQNAVRTRAAGRYPYVDPAAPYKANRLSSPRATEPILNIPGQTTVLTREVLDDMKATSLKDALRSTAGVTVGR